MATPYEFVANQLRTHLPSASVEPSFDSEATSRRDRILGLYRSGGNGDFGEDYSTFNLQYPGGYSFYYPLLLTQPGHRTLRVRIAPGSDSMHQFTRPDAEIREHLAHYGYWRVEEHVDPEEADFWILILRLNGDASQYLILPTSKLKPLLSQAHNPEKFSLFLAKSGFCFAAQPLSTANRLAVLKSPSLLDAAEYTDLKMDTYLNNWQQLSTL